MLAAPEIRIANLSAHVGAAALTLSYDVFNDGDTDVGLLDRVPVHHDVRLPPSLDAANAYLAVDGQTLVVRKAILPIPPGIEAAEKVFPGITRLAAHSARNERMSLPLPVRAFDPHRQALLHLTTKDAVGAAPTSPRQASAVRLILGYFPIDGVKLVALSPDFPEVFRAVPPGAPLIGYAEATAQVATPSPFEALELEAVLPPPPAPGTDHG